MWQDIRQGKAGEQRSKVLISNFKNEESGDIFMLDGIF